MTKIKELEVLLDSQWRLANSARSQAEIQKLRAQALKTYRTLKIQLELIKSIPTNQTKEI